MAGQTARGNHHWRMLDSTIDAARRGLLPFEAAAMNILLEDRPGLESEYPLAAGPPAGRFGCERSEPVGFQEMTYSP
jgi:hypothetical protein